MSPTPPRADMSDLAPAIQAEVARLAASPEVRSAFNWFRTQEPQFTHWQIEIARISAPPFGESARGAWLAERFREVGLDDVRVDDVGNVFGVHPGFGRRYVALSAHIDTVFPANTPLNIRQQGSRLYGPGVSDNGAGVTAMLAIAALLRTVRLRHALPFVFIGNVGEEGEGDLRGMRHIFSTPRWKDSIGYSVVLDGAGADTIVAEALGSRRFEVIVRGPGGHSWSDFGAPNPVVILARAIDTFTATPVPTAPKTTFNIGVIRGGTSVNSIPESASMKVDIRSTSMAEMERLEQALRLALNRALEDETMAAEMRSSAQKRPSGVNCEVVVIGSRPAGELAAGARILQVVRAVDAQLGNAAQVQRASTDANIPLSLGLEAVAIGGGGSGGGAHTLQEWFDSGGRELGLKRILLTMLALAGVGE
jgi:tripeptide aminopeptidase